MHILPLTFSAWNKVWVNEPRRPQVNYKLEEENNRIFKLTLWQTGELKPKSVLPQLFEIALVYSNRIEEVSVNMNEQQVVVEALKGKSIPNFILFNSSGQGYGLFPVDTKMLPQITALKSSVMRASAYINLYEDMLSARDIKPMQLLDVYKSLLATETEELNLRLITNYLSDIFWRFTLPSERLDLATGLEDAMLQALKQQTVANNKKVLFKTFQNIALSKHALDTLYTIWQTQKPPIGVKLTEEDYTSLALTLAVKDYPEEILPQQLTRIQNIDRKSRLRFLMPALSSDSTVRDAFFASLKEEKNREKEAWVAAALDYLHHPLRAKTSQKYLQQSLDLLQEIQTTGDIFFPGSWLQSTFGSYQTAEAADVVRNFLKDHPGYNPKLKAKILQAADPLFRAEKLVKLR